MNFYFSPIIHSEIFLDENYYVNYISTYQISISVKLWIFFLQKLLDVHMINV